MISPDTTQSGSNPPTPPAAKEPLRVSVVMSTYNRGNLLEAAVRSVLDQKHADTPPFEAIVVDNNSTDATRDIIERIARTDARVLYLFEPRQGLSYARNAGIRAAHASIIAFTDDDVRVAPDWIATMVRAFSQHPEADIVGGRVLPIWPAAPPAWLTRDHWSPLALLDYGTSPVTFTVRKPIGILGANLACRRSVFDVAGVFGTDFQRVRDGIGSLEDHEFLLRALRQGCTGLYDAGITVHAEIQPNRLERRYHRRWHTGHGHFHALLRSEENERTALGTCFGVPAHLYRQALGDLARCVRAHAVRNTRAAFHHEVRLRFFIGFFRTRAREFLAQPRREQLTEVWRLVRSAAHWRRRRAGGEEAGSKRRPAIASALNVARAVDARWARVRRPHSRTVVFDARLPMDYAMMAPVHRRLLADPRIRTHLISSVHPERAAKIFQDAPRQAVLSPKTAMVHRFDAYIAADFVWAALPRGTRRVQMFHGVAGKWSRVYDRPDRSVRSWDRLFFINRRRLRNYIASGAIDPDSNAIRLVGMPKSDCLVDGSLTREGVLNANGMDPLRPTVLYAPTWTRFSSLTAMGEEVVQRLIDAGYRVLVKLHDNSLDLSFVNSGGVDWVSRLAPILARGDGHLIGAGDASPWLVAADALITDHSSIGFEYLLLDRPLIRIAMPELIRGADVAGEYVQLMEGVSITVERAEDILAAVENALACPFERSAARREVAAELFHDAGHATDRAVYELYALMELEAPTVAPIPAARCAVVRTANPAMSR